MGRWRPSKICRQVTQHTYIPRYRGDQACHRADTLRRVLANSAVVTLPSTCFCSGCRDGSAAGCGGMQPNKPPPCHLQHHPVGSQTRGLARVWSALTGSGYGSAVHLLRLSPSSCACKFNAQPRARPPSVLFPNPGDAGVLGAAGGSWGEECCDIVLL